VKQSNLVRGGKGWETISTARHFANVHLEVVTDQVQTPTRSKPRSWTIVHRQPAVIIAPMTRDGKIVLIHQERIPIRAAIWEMPSGQIDNVIAGGGLSAVAANSAEAAAKAGSAKADDPGNPAETVEQVALRELREEAGYQLANDGKLIALGHYFSSPGFTDEHGYFFLARPVERCGEASARDEGESILDCREFPLEQVQRMIAENEIRDANTLSMWARLAARGFLFCSPTLSDF
jgi:8-oxo-dGTP pyrophosphatase MutT (NUDIX family)